MQAASLLHGRGLDRLRRRHGNDVIARFPELGPLADLPAGTVTVTVSVSPGADVTATAAPDPSVLDFELVSTERATAAERARAIYVKAHVAFDKKAYRQVIELAAQAAELGEANGYYRMAALHLLGDAHFALDNKQEALQAYRDVLVIARAAFPKSRLPAILGPRVRQLEAFGQ